MSLIWDSFAANTKVVFVAYHIGDRGMSVLGIRLIGDCVGKENKHPITSLGWSSSHAW